MAFLLGIDTGGTYTDAVLLDDKHGVISEAKALTTKYDLSVGIQNAVQATLPHPPPDIQLVSLSSTLATNAIVEGKGSPICLLLIGYDPKIMADTGFEKLVDRKRIVFIPGGHTVDGEEQCTLDIKAARRAILAHAPYVAAFAISGFFGVRNPTHELRVKRLVHRLTSLPVTCGHELTTNLDAPRRALTVALNARLIPLLQQLILGVRDLLTTQGIQAPITVVKGDGSLVDAEVALERPVETIMSGPAASVIGALHLCDVKDAFVVDMGGTTTDIAAVRDGSPALNIEGAQVGDWQTMIKAADIHTTGLGGDSEIRLDEARKIIAGPRRVVPLSLLAIDYPSTLDVLRHQVENHLEGNVGCFVMRERPLGIEQNSLTSTQQELWELLSEGPVSKAQLLDSAETDVYFRHSLALDGLIERGLTVTSAFTPTDAVHVLGQYRHGSVEAADLGAEIWARRLKTDKQEFCERVVKQVLVQAGHAVIESALNEDSGLSLSNRDGVGRLLINRALGADDAGSLNVTLSLQRPIVGIGAPAATYLTPLAKKLGAHLYVPEHAEVANAIGAVASRVVQRVRILIHPMGDEIYRVHSSVGVRDFQELTEATAYATSTARRSARHLAHQASASRVKIYTEQNDWIVPIQNDLLYLGTEIVATAIGRPRLKG